MAVYTDRSIAYHIPKCGGIWVKEAMRQSGLRYGRVRNLKHSHPFALRREHSAPSVVHPDDKEGRFAFCFVRHPLGWLRSFWCYRVKTGNLDPKFPADACWDDLFDIFVDNLVDAYPNGFVTQLYRYYVHDMDYIGRQENLEEDLIEALVLAGEEFNEADLRATRWRNLSALLPRLGAMCLLSKGTQRRALEAESWVLETFYRDQAA